MPERSQPPLQHDLLLSDYHCHCDFSIDATGTIEEYCRAALDRGLAEICFTTHYDANPKGNQSANRIRVEGEDLPATPKNLAPYVKEVEQAARIFHPLGLTVRLGLEFGWYPNCEELVRQLQMEYDIEYMLCGIHELDNICFCCKRQYRACFDRYSLEKMLEKHFDDVKTAARSGLFDTIAHLDYYKKYGLAFYGDDVLTAHEPYLSDVFQALIDGDTCLEINTAARRKGLEGYFPSLDIIHAARRAGVSVYYLGSDAHTPADVGCDFDLVAPLAGHAVSRCED